MNKREYTIKLAVKYQTILAGGKNRCKELGNLQIIVRKRILVNDIISPNASFNPIFDKILILYIILILFHFLILILIRIVTLITISIPIWIQIPIPLLIHIETEI